MPHSKNPKAEKRIRQRRFTEAFVSKVYFKKLYERDGGVCQICGLPVAFDKAPEKLWSATIDHVVPLSRGGTHEPCNCQLAHRICNSVKLQSADEFSLDWEEMVERDRSVGSRSLKSTEVIWAALHNLATNCREV